MSIVLGLAMEVLTSGAMSVLGKIPGLREVAADTLQKVSWGVLVCVGVAAGTAASKARIAVSGLAGLVSAPLAFTVAKAVYKAAAAGLSLSPQAAGVLSPLMLAGIKGAEYAALGSGVAWVIDRTGGGLFRYAGLGLAAGVIFGGTVLGLTAVMSPALPPAAKLISLGINEVLFPVGCALVLFFSREFSGRIHLER